MQNDIAVVGLLCNVPKAKDIESFWELLVSGTEGLSTIDACESNLDSKLVLAGGFIDGIDLFDAERFSLNASEVTVMDPQHRLWLLACHALLEITGMAADKEAFVGVFASAGPPSYLKLLMQSSQVSHQSVLLGNVADCIATRAAYHLGLTGPSMTIQCGCSSSLVAVHQARMALLARQCDAAIVGGVHLIIPSNQGYTYVDGGFASPDGHCRPFSDDAAGTVLASGYGLVMLKRLADAKASKDTIYAVIKGSAVNNDGADKASFTAPSVNGQANVIAKALRVSGLEGKDIQYIEAHGTATPLGDPIELAALEQALGPQTLNSKCFIGSLKANIGHLDVASGIMGLIKTSLMLHHKIIPAQINFNAWNKKFTNHRFQIACNTSLWESETPRRAGVSAFGFGGTNAHVILEESPVVIQSEDSHPLLSKLFVLSQPNPERLWSLVQEIRNYLLKNSDISLPALIYSLQTGRKQYPFRLMLVVNSMPELLDVLGRVSKEDFTEGLQNGEFQVVNKSLHEIQKAWVSGLTIDWRKAYVGLSIQKINLPQSPAILKSYWVSEDLSKVPEEKIKVVSSETSIYRPIWQEVLITPTHDVKELQSLLLISSEQNQTIKHLSVYLEELNLNYYWIVTGDEFKQLKPNQWQINTDNSEDLKRLITHWRESSTLPKNCVLAFEDEAITNIPENLQKTLFHLFNLPSLLSHLTLLSIVSYEHSATIGLCRSIGQEYAHLRVQLLDLEPDSIKSHPSEIIQSICMESLSDVLVFRQGHCYQQEFKSWTIQPYGSKSYFKPNGVYIITGGLGDVASVYVDFLAETANAHILLIGRTPIPPENEWEELLQNVSINPALRKKIERLKSWKAKGYLIQVYNADVTNKTQMERVFADAVKTFGHIDGFIHIAGAGSDLHYKILSELTLEHCLKLFAPKLLGIEILGELANLYKIKQCVVISSISSCLTGIGLGAYGASHNLLDKAVKSKYPNWLLMNWDAWNFYQDDVSEKEYGALGDQIEQYAISPKQGLDILRYLFQKEVLWQQVFISLADLNQRYHYWARRGFVEKIQTVSTRHPRPNLITEYRAPLTSLQKKLVLLWQDILGIEPVGIYDNFFELGGHSLLALSMIQSLQTELQLSCSVMDLFSAPTIAQLADKFSVKEESVTKVVTSRITKQLDARKALKARGLEHVNE